MWERADSGYMQSNGSKKYGGGSVSNQCTESKKEGVWSFYIAYRIYLRKVANSESTPINRKGDQKEGEERSPFVSLLDTHWISEGPIRGGIALFSISMLSRRSEKKREWVEWRESEMRWRRVEEKERSSGQWTRVDTKEVEKRLEKKTEDKWM